MNGFPKPTVGGACVGPWQSDGMNNKDLGGF